MSFDVPLPADYGGVIDVFYRVKALHDLGVKITLHCFEYGRGRSKELEQYAEKVIYYRRRKKLLDVMTRLPFIVKTRISVSLRNNLLKDDAPILFEGLHTTFFLSDERFRDRIKIVRTHNIEHEYYHALAQQATGIRKRFYATEAKKLKAYEAQLKHATHLLAIKEDDAFHLRQYCPNSTYVLPACANVETHFSEETEPYCLFQGNLSVPENEHGLIWLIEQVFAPHNLTNTLKVAGKSPSDTIISICDAWNIQLIPDPQEDEMQELLNEARVHVFYSEQDTGIKLKLVNALCTSGAILANKKMLFGTDFENLCDLVNTPDAYADRIRQNLLKPVPEIYIELRKSFIATHLDPRKNCQIIVDII